ncbi:MAG: S-layer homology domain-containing protein [Waterburya sp.]
MTNSSPQEPQNPPPEDRQRAVGGVTFDEMIAIIVAFTTIGAILFWALGDTQGRFANNFGFGKNANWLSADKTPAIGLGVGNREITANNSELGMNEKEDNHSSRREFLQPQSSTVPAKSPPNRSVPQQSQSNKANLGTKLAPLAGVATLPRSNVNPQGNIDKANSGTTEKAPSKSTPEATKVPNDVTPSYWAYPFVKQMSEQGLVPDFQKDQDFNPNKLITRAGMATLISQAFNMQPETQKIKKFKDVTSNNAIPADVDKAVGIGFMQGYSDNEFRPLEDIPRYQVLVTLATGLGLKPSQDANKILQKFDDGAGIPDWAKENVAAAAEAGLIVNPPGMDKNFLNPNQSATRAEVAAMIYQALVTTGKVKPLESEYIVNP